MAGKCQEMTKYEKKYETQYEEHIDIFIFSGSAPKSHFSDPGFEV